MFEIFFLVDEDVRILEDSLHAVAIRHEVWGEVTAVELHAFDDVRLSVSRPFVLLDRDDAFFADLVHAVREDLADVGVTVCGDGSDLGDRGCESQLRDLLVQVCDDGPGRLVDADLDVHWVCASCDELRAAREDGLCEHGGSGCAITGDVGGAGGDLLDHLCAHVFELVFKFDLLGDGHTVLGDERGPEALLEDDVTALRSEGDADGVCEAVDAGENLGASGLAEEIRFA